MSTRDGSAMLRRTWILGALSLTLAISSATMATGMEEQPVLWQSAESGAALNSTYRLALQDAIRQVAHEASVILCSNGGSAESDPALEEVCLREFAESREEQVLSWNADIEITESRIGILTLSLAVSNQRKGERWQRKNLPVAKNIIVYRNVLDPSRVSEDPSEEKVALFLYEAMVSNPEIRDWLADMYRYPVLLREKPKGTFPSPDLSRFASDEGSEGVQGLAEDLGMSDEVAIWEEQEDEVADLLIEGANQEAQERASELLLEDRLPANIRDRTQWLLEIAEQRVEEAKIVEAPPPATRPVIKDVTFPVRTAAAGSGFRGGTDGRLRISQEGLRFTPADASDEGWRVSWASLLRAGPAEGLWDVAFPLEIRSREGKSYFLVAKSASGGYGDGKDVLAHIDRGKKSQ